MSLLELGALGELIGGAAIIASLIYVGIQVRQNTMAQRLNTAHQMSEGLSDLYLFPASSDDLARIFIAGLTGEDALEGTDQMRFYGYLHKFYRTQENAHYHFLMGALDPDAYEGISKQFQFIASTLGGLRYWADRGSWYNTKFQAYVEKLMATHEQRSIRLAGSQAVNRMMK